MVLFMCCHVWKRIYNGILSGYLSANDDSKIDRCMGYVSGFGTIKRIETLLSIIHSLTARPK